MNYPFYLIDTNYQIKGNSETLYEFKMVYNFHSKIDKELLGLLEAEPKGIYVFARITKQLQEGYNMANPTISPIGQLIHQQDFSLEYLKSKMTFRDGLFADFIYFLKCADEKAVNIIYEDLELYPYSREKS
jgi:hypothetical protein